MWILIAVVAALLVLWRWTASKKNERFMQLASKLGGPRPLPLIGNALEYGTDSQRKCTLSQSVDIWLALTQAEQVLGP